jgi:hypothetical protein
VSSTLSSSPSSIGRSILTPLLSPCCRTIRTSPQPTKFSRHHRASLFPAATPVIARLGEPRGLYPCPAPSPHHCHSGGEDQPGSSHCRTLDSRAITPPHAWTRRGDHARARAPRAGVAGRRPASSLGQAAPQAATSIRHRSASP